MSTQKKLFFILLSIIGLLLILHLGSYWNMLFSELGDEELFELFNFNEEKNAPTIFSFLLLIGASAMLLVVGLTDLRIKKNKPFWFSMSFIFLFLAFDELLRIHEKIGGSLSDSLDTSGIFFYAWVIPYGILLIVLLIFVAKPLFELPKKTRMLFILSGLIFVSGALGIEMYTGWYIQENGYEGQDIKLFKDIFILYTVEEFLEMFGSALFVYSITDFLLTFKTKG